MEHYAYQESVIVLVFMIARFLLLSNAAKHTMHPGQNWVFTKQGSTLTFTRSPSGFLQSGK